MWETLAWRNLDNPEIARELEHLREGTLRLFLLLATGAYLVWSCAVLLLGSQGDSWPEDGLRFWTLLPVVALGLGASHALARRGSPAADAAFLGSSVLSATAAVMLFRAPSATLLFPVVALAAVVLLHPLAGLLVGVASSGLLLVLWLTGPLAWLATERLVETGVASLLAVLAAWALGRNMIVAVGWALDAHGRALESAQAAQEHRGELVRALRQLDVAYYRQQQANAALQVAWKAAEQAERSRSDFVTNISHELRTPLNLIVGFSELILTSPETYGATLPGPYRTDLNAIYRSAQHLLTLTNDVIDLARVGADRLALAREPTALGAVVAEACDIVREYVVAKGLRLDADVPADLPLLDLDGLRIKQVLLNLLTNAARFTERGGITVSASPERSGVVVRVADTGWGIPPGEIAKVFEEFRHDQGLNGAVPDGIGGIGLGLPISRRLVELHGGEIGVESTVGVGTTFWFSIPSRGPADGPAGEDWRPSRLARPAPAGERVVVLAGADAHLARFLEHHLRSCRIVAAPTLHRAVAKAAEVRAQAILADSDGTGGADELSSPVPIVRLPLPHRERIASALGAAAYLSKPVTRATLLSTVTGLVGPTGRILVVDDDARFVQLMTRFLEGSSSGRGREIQVAHNGREALSLMASARPDVVLLDLAMPDMDGRQVLAAMAADPGLAGVPVVVVSGEDRVVDARPLEGAISFWKPEGFRLDELLGSLDALLGALRPPRAYLTAPTATPT